jgi:glycosyltransferase involved in cell wall biosynthesis
LGRRLLVCTHEPLLPLSGGCTIGNLRLVEGLRDAGWEVAVLSPLNLDLASARALLPGVDLRPFQPWRMGRNSPLRFLRYAAYAALYGFRLAVELRRRRPAVILVRNAVLALPCALAARLGGVPALLSYTDLLSELLASDSRFPRILIALLRAYECRVGRLFDGVTVISRPLADRLVEAGVDPRRVTLSLDGADPTCFFPGAVGAAERARRRRRLGLRPGQRLALFHGTVEAHHGQDLLPRLLARAALEAPELRFLLIAGGPGAAALQAAVAGLPNAHFLPFQPPEEVGRWAACADVGFIPYKPTPGLDLIFTLKLLEYFAAGLPVVSFRLRAAQSVFGPSPAWSVAADETAFIAALARLARRKGDPALRRKVLKDFTWSAVTKRLDRHLRSLASGEAGSLERCAP